MAQLRTNQKATAVRLRDTERRLILLVGDFIIAAVALLVALYFWASRDAWLNFSWKFLEERTPLWFWFLPLFWIILLVELYDIRHANRRKDTLLGLLGSAGVGLMLYLTVFFISPPDSLPRLGVAYFIAAVTVLTMIWRMLYIRIFTAPLFMRRVLIVGAGRQGSELCRVISVLQPPPFHLIGLVDDDPAKQNTQVCGYPVIGSGAGLDELIEEHAISDLIFAISSDISPELLRTLLRVQERGVELSPMPAVYEELIGRVPIFLLESDWILRSFAEQRSGGVFYDGMKRLMDIAGGLVGTLIFALATPVISLLIYLETGWPVIFTQSRLGKNGEKYTIIKFRTMRQATPKSIRLPQAATSDDVRITRVGRFLRKSHLDELPQFINILKGEMSLVGPRAEQAELVDRYQNQIPFYRARLLVKPGLSGWAQVNFGYAANVEETASKLEYDLYYIKHRNLLLDIVILIRTFSTVFGFKGQ